MSSVHAHDCVDETDFSKFCMQQVPVPVAWAAVCPKPGGQAVSEPPSVQSRVGLYKIDSEQVAQVVKGLDAPWQLLHRRISALRGGSAFINHFYRVEAQGEAQSARSAFSARMNRPAGQVTLAALWVGEDAAAVLKQHVVSLRLAGFSEIVFQLDAGEASQAILGPALLASGFAPQYILPWGGKGDVLVWTQREEA